MLCVEQSISNGAIDVVVSTGSFTIVWASWFILISAPRSTVCRDSSGRISNARAPSQGSLASRESKSPITELRTRYGMSVHVVVVCAREFSCGAVSLFLYCDFCSILTSSS